MSKQFYFKQFNLAQKRSLNAKNKVKPGFSSIKPIDKTLIRCYHSGQSGILEWWQWRGTPHSPKLQHYWDLTIRSFSVISSILVAEMQSVYSTAPADRAIIRRVIIYIYMIKKKKNLFEKPTNNIFPFFYVEQFLPNLFSTDKRIFPISANIKYFRHRIFQTFLVSFSNKVLFKKKLYAKSCIGEGVFLINKMYFILAHFARSVRSNISLVCLFSSCTYLAMLEELHYCF